MFYACPDGAVNCKNYTKPAILIFLPTPAPSLGNLKTRYRAEILDTMSSIYIPRLPASRRRCYLCFGHGAGTLFCVVEHRVSIYYFSRWIGLK